MWMGNRSYSPLTSTSPFLTSPLLPPFQPFSSTFPWVSPSLSVTPIRPYSVFFTPTFLWSCLSLSAFSFCSILVFSSVFLYGCFSSLLETSCIFSLSSFTFFPFPALLLSIINPSCIPTYSYQTLSLPPSRSHTYTPTHTPMPRPVPSLTISQTYIGSFQPTDSHVQM